MHDPSTPVASLQVATRRGSPFAATLAWVVILAACGYMIWEGNQPPSDEEVAAAAMQLSMPAEITAKLCVGLGEWSPDVRNLILDQASALDEEGRIGKAAKAVVAAELTGLEDARKALAEAHDQTTDANKGDAIDQLLSVLDRLYAPTESDETSAPESGEIRPPPPVVPAALSPDDHALLETHLGWVGKLAPFVRPLAEGKPQREALLAPLRKMPVVMIAFLIWAGMCLLGGLAAIITLLVLGLRQKLRHSFREASGHGAVYAEVFAIWIAIFVGGKVVVTHYELSSLWLSLVLTIGALVLALAWAVLRGISWRQVREDVGLNAGRGVMREVSAGVMTYCMAIPLLLMALLVTLGLVALQKIVSPHAPPPSHPVQEIVASGDWLTIAVTMVFASLIAPFVEETIFRGALFRHLRDGTQRMGMVGSFGISAVVSSLLFAAIHPQGWPFIPVLASLAFAFCLAREWRGSLLPGMVAHGLNNFVIMTLNVMLLGQ